MQEIEFFTEELENRIFQTEAPFLVAYQIYNRLDSNAYYRFIKQ